MSELGVVVHMCNPRTTEVEMPDFDLTRQLAFANRLAAGLARDSVSKHEKGVTEDT